MRQNPLKKDALKQDLRETGTTTRKIEIDTSTPLSNHISTKFRLGNGEGLVSEKILQMNHDGKVLRLSEFSRELSTIYC